MANRNARKIVKERPGTRPGELILTMEYDAFVCEICKKPAVLHKFVNRHTSSKAPILQCDVGGAKRVLPGFSLQTVQYEEVARACAGCGQPIRPGEKSIYGRSGLEHLKPECATAAEAKRTAPAASVVA